MKKPFLFLFLVAVGLVLIFVINLFIWFRTAVNDHIAISDTEEDRIVLVNLQDLSRAQISEVIDSIHKYRPAAIGINEFFRTFNKTKEDSLLQKSIKSANAILAMRYAGGATYGTHQFFKPENQKTGISDFILDDDGYVSFFNLAKEGLEKYDHLAVSIARKTDSSATKAYLKKSKAGLEIPIVYTKRLKHFKSINAKNLALSPAIIEGKIVLLGDLGKEKNKMYNTYSRFYADGEDLKYNDPDMHATTILANQVLMILDQRISPAVASL